MLRIFTKRLTLSDGSEVWDVIIQQDGEEIVIACRNERDADRLQNELLSAISKYRI